jgi:hypothetical protein
MEELEGTILLAFLLLCCLQELKSQGALIEEL